MAYKGEFICQHTANDHGVSRRVEAGIDGNIRRVHFKTGMPVTCYGPRRGTCDHRCTRAEVIVLYAGHFGDEAIRRHLQNGNLLGEIYPRPPVEPGI